MKLLDAASNNSNDNQFLLGSKADNKKRNESDIDMYIIPVLFHRIIQSIENLCDICIKSRYTKIKKYKTMTSII